MSIYSKLLNASFKGVWFRCDLKKKNLWIAQNQIIKEGECNKDTPFIESDDLTNVMDIIDFECTEEEIKMLSNITSENAWNVLEILGKIYKTSVPTSRTKDSVYFKGNTEDEIDDAHLTFGIRRFEAKAILEGYIFLANLQGLLNWQNEEHWFWQSTIDKEFIVLKEWL